MIGFTVNRITGTSLSLTNLVNKVGLAGPTGNYVFVKFDSRFLVSVASVFLFEARAFFQISQLKKCGITRTLACCVSSFQIQPCVFLFGWRFREIFFFFLTPWPDLLFSSRFSLQILFSFLSQLHWIVESSQVKHHLFLCALGWYHSLSLPYSTFFCTFSQVSCIDPWLIWS